MGTPDLVRAAATRARRAAAGRVTVRAEIDADLRAWLDGQARTSGLTRAQVIERALSAARAAPPRGGAVLSPGDPA